MSLFQVVQFLREHPTRVAIVGVEALPVAPELISGGYFVEGLFRDASQSRLLEEIGRAPSELQSLMRISYAVFCLKKKTPLKYNYNTCTLLNRLKTQHKK